ncbi:MAG: radical SAM protein [Kiritimatiellae bacterium]|nr:radical SAM protein [Kiritimatiellia bacterium]
MRIALLNPPWYDEKRPELWGVRAGSRWPHFQKRAGADALPRYVPFPFFLAIAAACAQEAGHDVALLDGVAEGLPLDDFCARVGDADPQLIFVETSTPSLSWDLAVLRRLREQQPGAVLVCGGTHAPGLVPALLAGQPVPDYWLAGEYEQALTRLAGALAARQDLTAVPGLISREHAAREPARIRDVNGLPAPLYELLPVTAYSDPVCGLPAPSAQTWTSRGCPYGCTFCVWPQLIYGNRLYRKRDVDTALAEVDLLIGTYGCESFYFDDDTTNIGDERMAELSRAIRARGLNSYPWAMMARADCMSPRMIEALAEAGLYSVKYGVESVSPRLLDACNKGTRLAPMREAIRLTKAAGIKQHLTFTFGVPGETRATIDETVAFLLDAAPETAQFSICTPFPGTAFHEACRAHGWLVTEDWDRYLGSGEAVVQTPSLSAAALEAGYAQAVQRWDAFCAERLAERKKRLVTALQKAVAGERRWTLIGERDFAAFLWERGGEPVCAAYDENASDDAHLPVVISRHDEEKLWRRLARTNPARAGNALRLYG